MSDAKSKWKTVKQANGKLWLAGFDDTGVATMLISDAQDLRGILHRNRVHDSLLEALEIAKDIIDRQCAAVGTECLAGYSNIEDALAKAKEVE